jgi:soluble lytic murein transglycosylase
MLYFEKMREIIFIIILFLFTVPSVSIADLYKYIDKNGVVHFTNIPKGKQYDKVSSEKRIYIKGKKTREDHSDNRAYYSQIIDSTSKKYNLEPSLIKAVIKVESDWNSRAVSSKGAQGLMQLMPTTAKNLNVKNPYSPKDNINGGAKYLRHLLDRFDGDISLALAAYNAGPAMIEKYGGIPPITETRKYVNRVLSIYNGKNKPDLTTAIYKVKISNGTVLYTNTPFLYQGNKISRF